MKTFPVILLVGFLFTAASAGSGNVSVMSFNIRFGSAKDGENSWPHRKDLVVEAISRFDPDLLGLQESVGFQVEFLAGKLPEYEVYSVPRTPDGGESCAIFFRKSRFEKVAEGTFWLSETPSEPGSKSWDSSLPRIVSWVILQDGETGRKLVFANTHFDHRGEIARLESAKLIRTTIPAIAKSLPFVVTGDFNCIDGSAPHLALLQEESPFLDTYRVLYPEVKPERDGTFTGFQERHNERRIDWVLCSSDLHVKSAAIDRFRKGGRVPSDHYPVTAVLQFGGEKKNP